MPVENVMEKVVRDVLLKHKDELHLPCTCAHCLDDIMALALNQLPPRYIVNNELSPYVRASHVADHQGATNILLTVTKAAGIVSANPRCEWNKTNDLNKNKF
ncbi:late competence development ComFB family protein [Bacillus niameyensis]|uniref:late competence development ComFB family protein n=1 Tax=Bacillus niameyensis TaxID=1522308 RepID=UPI0007854676|nr:late competence development ComFB family protein [Bacillus niameyensis]